MNLAHWNRKSGMQTHELGKRQTGQIGLVALLTRLLCNTLQQTEALSVTGLLTPKSSLCT